MGTICVAYLVDFGFSFNDADIELNKYEVREMRS